jgi:hypothetical protein
MKIRGKFLSKFMLIIFAMVGFFSFNAEYIKAILELFN